MKNFSIHVEQGPCGWDFYKVTQSAETLEEAAQIVRERLTLTENRYPHGEVNEGASSEIVPELTSFNLT